LFLPVALVVVFSFHEGTTSELPFSGPTGQWYDSFLQDDFMVDAVGNSLLVLTATVALSLAMGISAAWAVTRYGRRSGAVLLLVVALPLVLPHLLIGVALLAFFNRVGVELSLLTVIVGHVLVTAPFVVFTIQARLATLDPAIEEAGKTLGASPGVVLRRLTLPLMMPSIVGAALLVASWSLDEFVVTFFTAGADQTLPLAIWGQMRTGVSPVVNAISTLMIAATLIVISVVYRLTRVRFD
jgi:spermidine/putrescine transport system permease protein